MSAAASGVSGACGLPGADRRLRGARPAWRGALGRTADSVSGLGTTMNAAAAIYLFTDLTAIP